MTDPLSLEIILAEFNDSSEAWVLQDRTSKKYVCIPHPKYPGRNPVHFFLSKADAERVLTEILDVNWPLKNRDIFPVSVKLLKAIRSIAADKTSGNADGFVVHPPNEVFEFISHKISNLTHKSRGRAYCEPLASNVIYCSSMSNFRRGRDHERR